MPDISIQDILRLFEQIMDDNKKIAANVEISKETSVLAVKRMIDLDKEFQDFRNEMLVYRQVRNRLEVDEVEAQMKTLSKKFESIKGTGSTQEKIDKAIEQRIGKKMDWAALWRDKIVPAVLTTLAIAFTLALLTPIIRYWLVPALLSAFGGK